MKEIKKCLLTVKKERKKQSGIKIKSKDKKGRRQK